MPTSRRADGSKWLYIYVGLATLAFAAIAYLAHVQQRFFFDLPATQFLQGLRNPAADVFMRAVSWPGFPPQFVLMFAVVLVGFFIARWWLEAAIMVVALIGVGLTGFGLKPLVGRLRPPSSVIWVDHPLTQDPYTFTAGHIHTFMVIYGWILFLALTRLPRRSPWRWPLAAGAVVVLVVEGISRVYLGDHWTSDVLAAYLLGSIWLALEIIAYRRLRPS
jgi:undecaprenyl-diphosphatase